MKCIHLLIENMQKKWWDVWICIVVRLIFFYPVLDGFFFSKFSSYRHNKNKSSFFTIKKFTEEPDLTFQNRPQGPFNKFWLMRLNVYTPTQHAHKLLTHVKWDTTTFKTSPVTRHQSAVWMSMHDWKISYLHKTFPPLYLKVNSPREWRRVYTV